jgi:phospholipase D1/2
MVCGFLKQFVPGSGGPREPWHDLHCKVEGHAAYDVLTNFEQRWRKATSRYDDELIDIERHEGICSPSNRAPDAGDPALFVSSDQDPETWHVQVISLSCHPHKCHLSFQSG